MTRKYRLLFCLLFLLPTGVIQATPISVTFVGARTGVNDGMYYVLPYQLSMNQGSAISTVDVICYDVFDDVNVGQSWTANILDVAQAASAGFFAARPQALANYEKIAWLSAQNYSNTDQQVALQHAIWNVMGSSPAEQNGRQRAALAAYQNAATAAAAGGYTGFDFSQFGFIEQVGGVAGAPGTEQAFVYSSPALAASRASSAGGATPEPGTLALFGGGVLLLLLYRRRMKNSAFFNGPAARRRL